MCERGASVTAAPGKRTSSCESSSKLNTHSSQKGASLNSHNLSSEYSITVILGFSGSSK